MLRLIAAGLLALLLGPMGTAQAGALQPCATTAELDAGQQDRLLRFGAAIKATLAESGQGMALIARSGLDLDRFGQRYSHAGISLKASANGPWSVRQLYLDCEQQRPRIFDQGLAGFLMGTADPSQGHVSLLLLPEPAATPLARAALDDGLALQLLGSAYSANAHAHALHYQNCNQWLIELLAVALGDLAPQDSAADSTALRARAQQWLQAQAYLPTTLAVGNPLLMWLAGVLPWLHTDDHPAADIAAGRFVVSMPASIEAFVRARVPGAQRVELCHNTRHIVVRQGWLPIAEGCQPAAGDAVISLVS